MPRSLFLGSLIGAILLISACGGETKSPEPPPAPAAKAAPEATPAPTPEAPTVAKAAATDGPLSPTLKAFLDGLSDKDKARTNPMAGDAAATAKGKEEFQSTCAPCHGPTGHGDGPAAAALNPRPARLADPAMAKAMTPGAQYAILKSGIPGTGMAAFGAALTDEQVWRLVTYVESLSQEQDKPAE